ncbi:MAG: hypothetical protein KIT31_04165 [Deltaproteobacteria bacterium]|nr:hypothetical protein [Deltaproteobacteria bacterium]
MLAGSDAAGAYFAARVAPALPAVAASTNDTAVFLVDTSLSSNPDRFNIYLALLRGVLDANRDTLRRFNVLFWSVDAHWYSPQLLDNTPANVDAVLSFANTLALEGATDLGAALAEAARVEAPRYDVFLLSDGAATWGESSIHALGKTLGERATLYGYQTGLAGGDNAALAHLARATGGAVFTVTGEAELPRVAVAHRARPWRLVGATVAGGTDVMLAGRPTSLFPDQDLVVVGRGAAASLGALVLELEQGGRRTTVKTPLGAAALGSPLAARAYGQIATAQLEELEDATADVARAYATNFRVTGRTCSLLMLESEADYARFNIRPENDARTVATSPASSVFAAAVARAEAALADPKAAFLAHLARLEKLPNVRPLIAPEFRALLAKLPPEVFAVPSAPVPSRLRAKAQLPSALVARLAKQDLDYDALTAEARRRGGPDALKALSSLVEANPGDAVLARDVGFSALELGLRTQAYHLFRRVAAARPQEPQTYRAMAQALAQMGRPELALAYFELPLSAVWEPRFGDLRTIVELDYLRFLRKLETSDPAVRAYAAHRLEGLAKRINLPRADVVVSITWNTDATDVDLHVTEPSGEECFYQHRDTRSGGRLTQDVTQGYGPEMYVLPRSPAGTYRVRAHYYASDRNRMSARSKVYATIIEDWGTPAERVTERTVTLESGKDMHDLATIVRKGAAIAR